MSTALAEAELLTAAAGASVGPAPLTPRPHQLEALADLADSFRTHARATLVSACGSGKSYTAAWHAQRSAARTVLVLAPSLALVAQAAQSWRDVHAELRLLVVCSDPSTAAGAAERGGVASSYDRDLSWLDLHSGERGDVVGAAPQVTTRAELVASYLDGASDSAGAAGGQAQLTLVVSTYHSAPAVARALTLTDTDIVFDLVVCDEAHHLAGRVPDAFAVALRDSALPARQRLFMTATPVLLGNLGGDEALDDLERLDDDRALLCMSDTTVFGPVAHRLPAGEAIARGLLADYRVLVVAGHEQLGEDASLHALIDAVRRHGIRRILTFHNRVDGARNFAAAAQALGDIDGIDVFAAAVDGTMSAGQIRATLDRLEEPAAAHRITIVASSRVLREGLDVAAVDGVVFCDPRNSSVDIVQAVGRALRLQSGKSRGTIVVPIAVRPDEDDDDQLAASRYGQVWRVLRALRAHDDRVAAQLDLATRRHDATGNSAASSIPSWLEVAGAGADQLPDLLTRIVRGSSAVWERWFWLLEQETERLGSAALVTTSAVVGRDRKLGVWVAGQRSLHARSLLHPDKVGRLEQLTGWSWSSCRGADERTLHTLRELAAANGTIAERDTGTSVYAGLRDGQRRPLGLWLARARRAHRGGGLDAYLVEQLQALPGWSWDPLPTEDRAGIEALRSFVMWEKHVDVTARHEENGFELGRWVLALRRGASSTRCRPRSSTSCLRSPRPTLRAPRRGHGTMPAPCGGSVRPP